MPTPSSVLLAKTRVQAAAIQAIRGDGRLPAGRANPAQARTSDQCGQPGKGFGYLKLLH